MSRVLIVGITGHTGRPIADELLTAGNFTVSGLVRPASVNKTSAKELQASGVDIRVGEVNTDSVEKLRELLKDVDVLILSVVPFLVDQRNVIRAAKEAGVKRVVPSEFGPHAPRGVHSLIDQKYALRDFIISLGLGYTFIEVGWWLQFLFPFPHSMPKALQDEHLCTFMGKGDVKAAATDLANIAGFVRRIIQDPRTLNKTVLTWDVEISLSESWKLAEKKSGEDFADYPRFSAEEIGQRAQGQHPMIKMLYEYMDLLYVRGDNQVSKAVAAGVLDARALYPDYKGPNLEEYVEAFYKKPLRYELDESLLG